MDEDDDLTEELVATIVALSDLLDERASIDAQANEISLFDLDGDCGCGCDGSGACRSYQP